MLIHYTSKGIPFLRILLKIVYYHHHQRSAYCKLELLVNYIRRKIMKGLLRSIKSPISLVFLIMVMLTIFFLFHKHLIPRTTIFRTRMPLDQYNSDGKDLLQVLRAASMPSRTVILTMVDKSWAKPGSIVDLFLESFKIGQDTELLLNHLVIVATDSTAFHYCKSIHSHCIHLFKATKNQFRTLNYPTLALKRNELLKQVLQFGYNLVYTDVDVMWLRNPFPLFHGLAQMTIGCDSLYSSSYQDSDSEMASGGFFYIQADEKSIQFFNLWRLAQVLYPNTQNESLCETVLKEDFITMVDFTPMFLKTKYYGGFCHPHNDIGKIYTLHANCCDDLENKVHDIKIVFDELRNYRSILAEGNSLGALSYWGRAPERCRRSKT